MQAVRDRYLFSYPVAGAIDPALVNQVRMSKMLLLAVLLDAKDAILK